MGTTQQQPKPLDPERLAALVGRFDIGNPSDAEALNAARMIRRMVGGAGVRFIDALERPDVREALDTALQPVRAKLQDGPALLAAQEETKELRDRLAVVVPKLREVTEALTREIELAAELRKQALQKRVAGVSSGSGEPLHGGLIAVVTVLAIGMLIASAFSESGVDQVKARAAVMPQSEITQPKREPHGRNKGRKGQIRRNGRETNKWTGKP